MKTTAVVIAMCLNIGVDPPDVVKASPCARDECGLDPRELSNQRQTGRIPKELEKQYEQWQMRCQMKHRQPIYHSILDPSLDQLRQMCTHARRHAERDRVIFHYNGHGVPRPTPQQEIWVFNEDFTKYIPVLMRDIVGWLRAPSVYVFDCSDAGVLLDHFVPREPRPFAARDNIVLCACGPGELLPMNDSLPADIFTACLTSPIQISLQWFCVDSVGTTFQPSEVRQFPGHMTNRHTALGELNWIFTAITDTIAWNTCPRELFPKLFRQDLLVSALFRHFLLAERIMRSSNCTPMSYPALPPAYHHPLWQAWDLATDLCLQQLPMLLAGGSFVHTSFFREHLDAFEVWLSLGVAYEPPDLLPIVLQALLSQVHRPQGLSLLARFLALGSWAVKQAITIGIIPYVMRLLSTPSDLRTHLVEIWTRILTVDRTCHSELIREGGHVYFTNLLQEPGVPAILLAESLFNLSVIVSGGRELFHRFALLPSCMGLLHHASPLVRLWAVLCLTRFYTDFPKGKLSASGKAMDEIVQLLHDPAPEVRAASVHAVGAFFTPMCRIPPVASAQAVPETLRNAEHTMIAHLVPLIFDGSTLVRYELAVALSTFITHSFHYLAEQAGGEAQLWALMNVQRPYHFHPQLLPTAFRIIALGGTAHTAHTAHAAHSKSITFGHSPNESSIASGTPTSQISSPRSYASARSVESTDTALPCGASATSRTALGDTASVAVPVSALVQASAQPQGGSAHRTRILLPRVTVLPPTGDPNAAGSSTGAQEGESAGTTRLDSVLLAWRALCALTCDPDADVANTACKGRMSLYQSHGSPMDAVRPGGCFAQKDADTALPKPRIYDWACEFFSRVGPLCEPAVRPQFIEIPAGPGSPPSARLSPDEADGEGAQDEGDGKRVPPVPPAPLVNTEWATKESAAQYPELTKAQLASVEQLAQVGMLDNDKPCTHIAFHKHDPILAVGSSPNISFYEFQSRANTPTGSGPRDIKLLLRVPNTTSPSLLASGAPATGTRARRSGSIGDDITGTSPNAPSPLGASRPARMAGLTFINEDYETLVMYATDDGVVRIVEPGLTGKHRLVSSFLAHPLFPQQSRIALAGSMASPLARPAAVGDTLIATGGTPPSTATALLAPSSPHPHRQSGVHLPGTPQAIYTCGEASVYTSLTHSHAHIPTTTPQRGRPSLVFRMAWCQHAGLLATAGSSDICRLWDVQQERCTQDIFTEFSNPTVCACMDPAGDTLILASKGGAVKLFDRRDRRFAGLLAQGASRKALSYSVSLSQFHTQPVSVCIPSARSNEIVVGYRSGEVQVIDSRLLHGYGSLVPACHSVTATLGGEACQMTSFGAHPEVPIYSGGYTDQSIRLFSLSGRRAASLHYNDFLLAADSGPIDSLAWHPTQLLLAISASNTTVQIFAPRNW